MCLLCLAVSSPTPIPSSCSLLLHSAPNFFPRKALRKRTSVRSLGPLPAAPGAVSCLPPPAISSWRLPSHVALQSSLACFLKDPYLTPFPSSFLPNPSLSGQLTHFSRGKCRGLGIS